MKAALSQLNSFKSKNLTQILVVVGALLLLLGSLYFLFQNRMSQTKEPDPTQVSTPPGPFYMVFGPIEDVQVEVERVNLKVKSDWGQVYSVEVNANTKLLPIEPPRGLREVTETPSFDYKTLKEGQSVNINSSLDLSKTDTISADKIKNLEVYIND
jgi:hypothetical protein